MNKKDTLSLSKYNIALTYYKKNQYNLALDKLREIQPEHSLKEYLKGLYFQWTIVSTHKPRQPIEKLKILNQVILHEISLEKKKKAQARAQKIIQTLKERKLESLIKEKELEALNEQLVFYFAKGLVKEKKFRKALDYFQELLVRSKDNSSLQKISQQYVQALKTRTKVQPRRIGAVLPLSGSYQKIGERCLKGLQLGLGIYDIEPSNFELVVKDSKGRPQLIREEVKDLLLSQQVIGLVGGVTSQVATVLSETAQDFMIPSILLSQKSQLTKDKPFIFQNSVNNKHIVYHLVDYLMDQEDHKNFAILYPNDRFGVEYSNLFWDYISSKGGNIKGAQTYKQGETDFSNSVKRLVGLYYVSDRDEEYREKLKIWFSKKRPYRNDKQIRSLLPPSIDFTALFIPDSIKSLQKIAPYLAFHDIEGVTLAGTSIWNSSQILKNDLKVENVIFSDALITKHPQFKESAFYSTFKSTFGYAPSLFEFLSYQSALALRQVIVSGSDSREELQEKFSQLKSLESPIGDVKISKNREFIYPITNFSIKDNKIISLNP